MSVTIRPANQMKKPPLSIESFATINMKQSARQDPISTRTTSSEKPSLFSSKKNIRIGLVMQTRSFSTQRVFRSKIYIEAASENIESLPWRHLRPKRPKVNYELSRSRLHVTFAVTGNSNTFQMPTTSDLTVTETADDRL